MKAINAIGCSNWHFEVEREANPEFADAMDKADKWGMKILDRVAIGKAIDGDSRLLQRVLTAKVPEYKDKLSVDFNNVSDKLTNEQINERILQLVENLGGRIDDAPRSVKSRLIEHDKGSESETDGDAGDGEPSPGSDTNNDLL
jgi:hypothetical protein